MPGTQSKEIKGKKVIEDEVKLFFTCRFHHDLLRKSRAMDKKLLRLQVCRLEDQCTRSIFSI
jgi:hypothetical protein